MPRVYQVEPIGDGRSTKRKLKKKRPGRPLQPRPQDGWSETFVGNFGQFPQNWRVLHGAISAILETIARRDKKEAFQVRTFLAVIAAVEQQIVRGKIPADDGVAVMVSYLDRLSKASPPRQQSHVPWVVGLQRDALTRYLKAHPFPSEAENGAVRTLWLKEHWRPMLKEVVVIPCICQYADIPLNGSDPPEPPEPPACFTKLMDDVSSRQMPAGILLRRVLAVLHRIKGGKTGPIDTLLLRAERVSKRSASLQARIEQRMAEASRAHKQQIAAAERAHEQTMADYDRKIADLEKTLSTVIS